MKPDYIEIQFRVRCDGWWRKTLIGAVMFCMAVGICTDLLKIVQSWR